MSTESTLNQITNAVNVCEGKIGGLISRLSNPNREWLTAESGAKLRARLIHVIELAQTAVSIIDRNTPPKAE